MATVALAKRPDGCAKWHQQIGANRGPRMQRGPRPLAAVLYHYRGEAREGLVELRRLKIDVLHDLSSVDAPVVHRLARYSAGLTENGVTLGGASRILFEKNLSYRLGPKSRGRRIGADDAALLADALQIDKFLERHSHYPCYPRRTIPKLPQFWTTLAIQNPSGAGPEFDRFCREFDWPVELALTSARRFYRGDLIFPLEYVAHHGRHIRAVYADMKTVSYRQVIRIDRPEDLIGGEGACRFDFWNSGYRQGSF